MAKNTTEPARGQQSPDPMLLALVAQFLEKNGFKSAHRIFNTERRKRPKKEILHDTFAKSYTSQVPPLETIFKTWSQKASEDSAASSDSGQSADSLSAEEKTSSETSSASNDSASDSQSNEIGSDDSESEKSSSDERGDKFKSLAGTASALAATSTKSVNPLKRMASESSSESSSDSEAEPAPRPLKKQKVQSPASSSDSSSSEVTDSEESSDSGSDSDSESDSEADSNEKTAPKTTRLVGESAGLSSSKASKQSAATTDSSSDSGSDSDSDLSVSKTLESTVVTKSQDLNGNSSVSSDSESSSDDDEAETAANAIGLDQAASDSSGTIIGDVRAIPSVSDSSASEGVVGVVKTTAIKKHVGAHPTRLAQISAAAQMEDYVSNNYVSYDYADKAYRDLSITRGKGFTKEKNKKKRGSYRGGAIDINGGKGFKFED